MNIDNSSDLIDLIRSRFSLTSDYQVAKMLDISIARVSNYRRGISNPDDSLILQVETLLKYPAGSLLFEMQAARTKCPDAAKIFHQTAQKIAAGVLCFMLVFPAFFDGTLPSSGHFFRSFQCILCKIKRVLICPPVQARPHSLISLFGPVFAFLLYMPCCSHFSNDDGLIDNGHGK